MQIAKKLGRTRKGSHLTEKLVVPSRTGIAGAWDIVSQQTGHELVTTHPDKAMDGVHWCPHPDVVQCTRPRQRVEVVRVHQRPVEIEEHAGPALVHWHSLRARGRPSRPNSPPPGLYRTRIASAQRWRRQNPSSRRTRTPWSLVVPGNATAQLVTGPWASVVDHIRDLVAKAQMRRRPSGPGKCPIISDHLEAGCGESSPGHDPVSRPKRRLIRW